MNPIYALIAGIAGLYLVTRDRDDREGNTEAERVGNANTDRFVAGVNAGGGFAGPPSGSAAGSAGTPGRAPVQPVPLLNPDTGKGKDLVDKQARLLGDNERVVERIVTDLNLRDRIYRGTAPAQQFAKPPHWERISRTPKSAQYIGSHYANRAWHDHLLDAKRRWSQIAGTKDARRAADVLELQRFGGTSVAGGSSRLWSEWMRGDGPYGKSRSLSKRIDDKERVFVGDALKIVNNLLDAADELDKALRAQAISDLTQAGIRFVN